MADWTPLTEEDPIPGDPDALPSLVTGLRNDMRELWNVVGELQGINAAGIWSGEAAEAFTRRREGVVPDLDRVANRLDRAAFALETFGQAVHESQFKALEARTKARAAQETITRTQLQIEETAHQEGPSITHDRTGVMATGEEAMAAARHLFDQACEVYTQAETRCDKLLADAIHDDLADPKKRGFLGSVSHAVGNIADHFTSLEKFSELMGATAAVCGVAAIVPGLQFLEPVALGATALKTAIDVGIAIHTGKGWNKVRQDAFAVGVFAVGRVATVAARGKVASKAAADLEQVQKARRARLLNEFEGELAGGKPVVGPRGARLVKNQSVRLLRQFGVDRFNGALPSWKRSVNAMRHLDIELPDQAFLDLSKTAVRWANTARMFEGVGHLTDALQLKAAVDPKKRYPGVLAADAVASPRPMP